MRFVRLNRRYVPIMPTLPIVRSRHEPQGLREYPSQALPLELIDGQNVAVISAIGNPDAFLATVKHCGGNVIAVKVLADHDAYSPQTVSELQNWIRDLGDQVSRVVCTHKDLVKLRTDRLGGRPLSAIMIELTILSGSEALTAALTQVVAKARDLDHSPGQ